MICRVLFGFFVLAYVAALAILATGTYGLFGQAKDPLSGIFLIPLGLPWILIPVPEPLLLPQGIAAPGINLLILWFVCRRFRK